MKNNYSIPKTFGVKMKQFILVLILIFVTVFSNQKLQAQNFELVTVSSVASGSNTNNALFVASSPTIPSLAFIRAQRIAGPEDGKFTISGDDIRYTSSSTVSGIPNNLSRIRFTFLQADGVTPIPVNDFRFIINDIDGPNNEALATDCGANLRFSAVADPTNLAIDNVPPDLSATGTVNENSLPTSRVMYEYNDVTFIEFDNYANNGYLKDFDMDNDLAISTPIYAVCLGDIDNDGVTDDLDLDDDNDGILDIIEAGGNDPNGDNDGDGLPNYLDVSDDSGASATYTANADGSVTDYTDANSDGVPDVFEASADADSLPNHLDSDSDNDGCPDTDEVYGSGTDADSNGYYGSGIPTVDANGLVIAAGITGATYNTLPPDNDSNGTDDYLQVSKAITGIATQPVDQTAIAVNNVTFNVVATTSGTGTVEQYKWQEQVNGVGSWGNLADGAEFSGVTTNTLTVTVLNSSHNASLFRAIISTPSYVCDTDQTSNTALLTITANVITANDDSGSAIESTASSVVINVLSNDNLAGATPNLTTVNLTQISSSSSEVSLNTLTGGVDVTAAAVPGIYTLVYQICEAANTTNCTTATVTVTVADAGNPTAVDDTASTTENTLVTTGNVLINDTIIDGATITSFDATSTQGGTVVNNLDGTFDYTPALNFAGTDTFTYTLCDNDTPTASCSTATVTVTVVDQGNPFAVNDSASTILNIPVVTGNVLLNDTVIDSATMTSFDLNSVNGGTVADNGGGTFLYTPPAGFIGIDTFTYTLCDDDTPTASCSTATVTVTVSAGTSDLVTTKVVNNATPDEGSTIVYMLTVTNNGANDATNVSLTDLLPSGVSYVSDDAAGAYNSGSGIWTIGSIANTATATLNITATVDAGTGGQTITNATTSATGDQSDPTTIGDVLTAGITVNNNADIVLTKVVDNATPNIGDIVIYTVTVTNNGPATATNLVVTDMLPGGLTFNTVIATSGTWTAPNWSIGTLASGVTETITIQAIVGAGTGGQTLTNTISNTQDQIDTNTTVDDASEDITVTSSDLVTTKTVDNATPDEGSTIVYTIKVKNNGLSDATGVSFTDLLPAGVTYVSHTTSNGTYNPGSGEWKIEGDPVITNSITNGSFETGDLTGWTAVTTGSGTFSVVNTSPSPTSASPTDGSKLLLFQQSASGDHRLYQDVTIPVSNPTLYFDLGYANQASSFNTGQYIAVNIRDAVTDAILSTLFQTLPGDAQSSSIQGYSFNLSAYAGQTIRLDIITASIYNAPLDVVIDNVKLGSTATSSILASGGTATINITATVDAGTGGQTITNATTSATGDQFDPTTIGDVLTAGITVNNNADIVLTKVVDNATPNEGDTVTYTVTVTNNGPAAVTSLVVNDALPVGLTYGMVTPSAGTITGLGVWSVGSLSVGATETVTIQAIVGAGTGGQTLINTVSNTQDQTDTNTTVDDASESITVTSSDLVTTKVVTNATPDEGSTIVYTLTVTNNGTDNATNVSLTDLLPIGVSYVSHSTLSGAFNSGSGIWTIGNIANGATATLNITATVDIGTGGTIITNFISAAMGDQSDPTTIGDVLTAGITVNNNADIVLTKVVDNATPNEGDTVTYTVTVTNNGPAAVTSLVVNDALPVGLTYGMVTPSAGTITGLGVWSVGSLSVGATETVTIQAIVGAGTGGQTLINTVSNTQDQTDTNTTVDDASESITVTSSDLVTSKTVDNLIPNEGDIIVYTLTVTNNGPSNATGVNLTDNLPIGVSYVSDDATGAYNSGSGIWTIGSIANTATATLNITATVDAGTGGQTITNATTSAIGDQSDPTTIGDVLTAGVTVNNNADIVLTKVVDNATPNEGDTVTYTVTVTNNGPAAVTSLVVNDALPVGLTYGMVTPSAGTITGLGVWSVGSLAVGATETVTIEATVGAGTDGQTLINTVSNTQDQTDTNTTVDDASESITVTSSDLVTSKTVDNLIPNEGDIIVYTLTVTNNGPSNATGVNLTDNLPIGVSYVSHSTLSGAFNSGSGIWTIGNIANGATATLNITATVDIGTGGTIITNFISAAMGDQSDPDATTDDLEESITVIDEADIVLTKVVDNATPNEGDIVTYTVTVTNKGLAAVTNLVVADALPAGLTYGTVTPSIGTWTSPNWSIGTLPSGATESITIEAMVNVGTRGQVLVNTVTNTQDQMDSNHTLDDPTATVTVTSVDLITTKTVSDVTPNEGNLITYTITVTNTVGGSDATGVYLTDNLPVGVTYVSHSTVFGTYNVGSGLWDIGNMTAGDTATLLINATVDDGTVGLTITNTTNDVVADQGDVDMSNNADSVDIIPVAIIDLSLTKTIVNNLTTPLVGDVITFEIRVANEGPTKATRVEVTDLLPSGYSFVNYSSTIGTYDPVTGLWNIGFIETGNTAVLLVDVTVLESGSYINCAEISAANEDDIDSTPGNASSINEDDNDCIETTPINNADLGITKTVVANNVTPMVDTQVTFEIRVTNYGPIDATEVLVTDLLPSGYTFVNYSSTIGTYNDVTGLWNIGTILNGDTEVLLVDAIVNVSGDYTNCTTITSLRQIDPDLSNNEDCASTTPIAVVDLELTKEVALDELSQASYSTTGVLQPYAESNVDFTLTLINNGPSEATGVQVTDLLPDGYNFVNSNPSVGTYDEVSGIWDVGTVGNGAFETLIITAYVNPIGNWVNIAEVTEANELDLDSTPGNGKINEDDMDQVSTDPIILITVPEMFTPDGDGINDTFEIEFLQILYPNFSMEIVNRYGNLVYKYEHNGDPNIVPLWWNGYSGGRWNLDNLELPVGTYFYTIYFNNNERKPQTGWIYLRR